MNRGGVEKGGKDSLDRRIRERDVRQLRLLESRRGRTRKKRSIFCGAAKKGGRDGGLGHITKARGTNLSLPAKRGHEPYREGGQHVINGKKRVCLSVKPGKRPSPL